MLLLDALDNQHFPPSTASARGVLGALVFVASSSRVLGILGATALNGIVVTPEGMVMEGSSAMSGVTWFMGTTTMGGKSFGESWGHGCLLCSQGPGLGQHCFPGSASSMCSNLPMFRCTGLSSILAFCDPLLSYVD